ncbi:MAG: hypothetical protein IKP40_08920, partial [Clostridia bacterium]|nr:hypothetical protein [Clostridia bacterium]
IEEVAGKLIEISEFFQARADMAVGDGKLLLQSWADRSAEAAVLLAERQPVEPVKSDIQDFEDWDACGYCKNLLVYGNRFCSHCGHEVKWT